MSASKLTIVVGGQLGSEGKGAITAYLGADHQNAGIKVLGVRVAGPNAGHTVLGNCPVDPEMRRYQGIADLCDDGHPDTDGLHPWRLRQVPVTAVSNPGSDLILAAGSEIDPVVLVRELEQLESAGYNAAARLMIDGSATIIEPEHGFAEREAGLTDRIGSTGKGIGAARQARLARTARTVNDWIDDLNQNGSHHILRLISVGHTAAVLNKTLAFDQDVHVIIEGTQGYGLGLHTENYPQVTSSDCRAIDFLAMAGISPWIIDTTDPDRFAVWVVLRTFPIRVAGNSGKLRDETTWEALGLPVELTTVTQKVRRVGEWDPALARESVQANGGGLGVGAPRVVHVALTMADYLIPLLANHMHGQFDGQLRSTYGRLHPTAHDELFDLVSKVTADTRVSPDLIGTGPNSIIDLRLADAIMWLRSDHA